MTGETAMIKPKLLSHQQGMVAIITTMILMIVISLIVVGFSQLVRRNQRQALDAQLSSQAFYAAESGLNLARKKLAQDPTFTRNTCDPNGDNYVLDADTNTKITCLLVSPVTDLLFTNVGTSSKVSLIQPTTGTVPSIFINWESVNTPAVTNCANAGNEFFPSSGTGAWTCTQPVLRVDLVPLAADGSISQAALVSGQYTTFLYPSTHASAVSSVAYSPGNRGSVNKVLCNTTPSTNKARTCMVELTNTNTSARYAIRIMSIYGQSHVTIHVRDRPPLIGGQVLADSTAVSVDVLKRVQARIPVGSGQLVEDFAIDSRSSVCKTYQIVAGNPQTSSDPGCTLP